METGMPAKRGRPALGLDATTTTKSIKFSANQIASIEAARRDGETWSACVRRLVEQAIDHLALTQNSDS